MHLWGALAGQDVKRLDTAEGKVPEVSPNGWKSR